MAARPCGEPPSGHYATTEQIARWLGLSPNTLQVWRCEGKGPPYIKMKRDRGFGFGRSVRYKVDDVIEWMEEGRVCPDAST